MGEVVNKVWRAYREDCSRCKHEQACGDIYTEVGKCPGNTGGEGWAIFEAADKPVYESKTTQAFRCTADQTLKDCKPGVICIVSDCKYFEVVS